ncbi:hypothetical protein [Nocardia terpenica]|uniref:hypothetical protein n=1 Tax=Nocardia terpenica TaxID=455432 RepID=UPI0012E8C137|nr:hypothetical protein [Nocardia terpenica]NQE93117.1 hypothetical protein [Nocardia terpenica]
MSATLAGVMFIWPVTPTRTIKKSPYTTASTIGRIRSLILLVGGINAFTLAELCLPLRAPQRSAFIRHSHGKSPMDETVWTPGFPHDAPDEPFTVTGAVMALKLHNGCPDNCPRKYAAAQALRDAHVSPSTGVR